MSKTTKSTLGLTLFDALVAKNGGKFVIDFDQHNDYLAELESEFAKHVTKIPSSDWALHVVSRDMQIDKRMCIACF